VSQEQELGEQLGQAQYGGRALRDGVLMVGPHTVAVAVRKADGSIGIKRESWTPMGSGYRRVPMVRGMLALGNALRLAGIASRLSVEARTDTPERLRVGQPVSVALREAQ